MQTLQFGRITVEPVNDGHLEFDVSEFFPDLPVDQLARHGGVAAGTWSAPLLSFLVRTRGRIVLVDTGLGPRLSRTLKGSCGELPDALARAGVAPEQVDTVIFTHLHFDHVGWATVEQDDQRVPTFPNARYITTPAEWARWSTAEAGYVARSLLPLAAAGQLDQVEDGHEPAPGVRLLATPGHTPGHVSILVYDGDEGGVITGDAAHHPAELEQPEFGPAFDEDPALAARSRTALVERIEQDGLVVLGGHFPAPHAGRVLRVEQRRVYHPLG